MATIKYLIKPSKSRDAGSKDKPVPIYVRIVAGRVPGQEGKKIDVMTKTSYLIKPSEWSDSKQAPKSTSEGEFKVLKHNLQKLKAELISHINNIPDNTHITIQWLKEILYPSGSLEGYPTGLIKYFDYYISIKRKELTDNSIKKFNVVKHKLERYEKEHGEILIKNINRRFKESFVTFCEKYHYSPNTIAKEIRFIKTICRHAKENGVETHYQMDGLKASYEKVENIYLTEEDIFKIAKAKLSDSLDNVRDWLLISCYTGQRISDFLKFNKDMIRTQPNRKGQVITLIEFTQQKTGKKMTLPLHKEVLRILDKRNGDFPHSLSDQKYNDYIKTVCREAGITEYVTGSKKTETEEGSKIYRKETGMFEKCELVSSHIGRRTFATLNYGKIPTSLLIAATGHSTEQMFLSYIGKSASDRAMELAEWF